MICPGLIRFGFFRRLKRATSGQSAGWLNSSALTVISLSLGLTVYGMLGSAAGF